MTDKKDKKNPELEKLELELKQLELQKAKTELRYLIEERAAKAAEAREKTASADKAELDLAVRRIDLTRQEIGHLPVLDADRGIFRLDTGVYERVLELVTVIQRFAAGHPGQPITLYIFSPGGSVMHGLALYDTLRTLSEQGHQITTVVRGYCASMASVIFLAGDIRRIGAESLIHQHEPSTMTGGRASEVLEDAKFVERLYEKLTNIYTSRTKITRTQFRSKTVKKEWYADATEALAFGIATEVG